MTFGKNVLRGVINKLIASRCGDSVPFGKNVLRCVINKLIAFRCGCYCEIAWHAVDVNKRYDVIACLVVRMCWEV